MATRSVIKIEGMKAVIYKHGDGYPSATLPWLLEFNAQFSKVRGEDAQYKFAQLLRDSAFNCEKFNLDDSKHIGWGVFDEDCDCGQEYEYTLKTDGTVMVRSGYGQKMKKMTKAQLATTMKEYEERRANRLTLVVG